MQQNHAISCKRRLPTLSRATTLASAALLITIMAPNSAQAQLTAPEFASFDAERWRLASDSRGILGSESATIHPLGHYSLSAAAVYSHRPLQFVSAPAAPQKVRVPLIDDRLGLQFTGSLGIRNIGQIGVGLSAVAFQHRTGTLPAYITGVNLSPAGLGDLRLLPKFQVLRQETHYVDLAVLGELILPTSFPRDDYMGESMPSAHPVVSVGHSTDRNRALLNVGFHVRSKPAGVTVVNHELTTRLGFAHHIKPLPVEVQGMLDLAIPVFRTAGTTLRLPLQLILGGAWLINPSWDVNVAVGAALLRGSGVPTVRTLVGFNYKIAP